MAFDHLRLEVAYLAGGGLRSRLLMRRTGFHASSLSRLMTPLPTLSLALTLWVGVDLFFST